MPPSNDFVMSAAREEGSGGAFPRRGACKANYSFFCFLVHYFTLLTSPSDRPWVWASLWKDCRTAEPTSGTTADSRPTPREPEDWHVDTRAARGGSRDIPDWWRAPGS